MEEKQTTKTTSTSTYDAVDERNNECNTAGRGQAIACGQGEQVAGNGLSSPWDGTTSKQKKHKTKRLCLFLLLTIVLASIGSGSSLLAYQKYNPIYHNDLSLAQTGVL